MTLDDFGRFLMLMLISMGIRIWNWTEVTAMSKGGGPRGSRQGVSWGSRTILELAQNASGLAKRHLGVLV